MLVPEAQRKPIDRDSERGREREKEFRERLTIPYRYLQEGVLCIYQRQFLANMTAFTD